MIGIAIPSPLPDGRTKRASVSLSRFRGRGVERHLSGALEDRLQSRKVGAVGALHRRRREGRDELRGAARLAAP